MSGLMVEPLHLRASRLAQRPQDATGIGHGPCHHLAHELMGRIGVARGEAIEDELVEVKGHADLPGPMPLLLDTANRCKPSTKPPAVPRSTIGEIDGGDTRPATAPRANPG